MSLFEKVLPMSKLKMWNRYSSWSEAETAWDQGAQKAAEQQTIQGLKQLPSMVGITPDTAKNLKWKSTKWMVAQDHDRRILKGFLRHPFKYGWSFLKSILKKKSYTRHEDFFFYGIKDLQAFQKLLTDENVLLLVGFSYCHKPLECPSGRFTEGCIHDPDHPVCRQCFIGKMMHALPEKNTVPVMIPTIHQIGGKVFDLIEEYPHRKIIFLITACEMTLTMFGDWGNMVGIEGIGVRLDGRICNTMKAFELSEKGIKPGLTVVREETKLELLNLIAQWRDSQVSR